MSTTVKRALVPAVASLVPLAMLLGLGCQSSVERLYDDDTDEASVAPPGRTDGGTIGDASDEDSPYVKSDAGDDDASTSDAGPLPAIIGGTVTALLGSGFVLQNNGKDDLEIASDGVFAFPTPLYPGERYDVTVRAQPAAPSQTCTVTKGTGTANGVDVTGVTVGCVTNTYKVSGTVIGLTGSGFVLQNNGGNDVAVAGGATTFTFPAPVPSGGNYNVTIKTQPSGPVQTCSVSGGQGTVVSADVTSVVVNCGTNTYTVGGTVSGLAGTLVIQNNGGDERSITANGNFAFPTPIASGSSYSVAVKTQPGSPIAQTCTVANGAGSIGSSNVSNVSITCTTRSFTVGGTVSGLSGSVVLQNNGTNDTTVSANGGFTFSTPIASGSPYAVSVRTQPSTQKCTVTGGSGTVAASNVTSVAVSCSSVNALVENFDGVTAPTLPTGWDSQILYGSYIEEWETRSSSSADSAPNVAFVPASEKKTDIVLVSPAFTPGSSAAELTFRHAYDIESRWDGAVLEIQIAGGSWQDIISAGGVFITGGYNRSIDTGSDCTLRGRQAWSQSNDGWYYITTTARLPAAAAGKSVRLRWRIATDSSYGESGWRIDSIVVKN